VSTEVLIGLALLLVSHHVVVGLRASTGFTVRVEDEPVATVTSSEAGIAEFEESVCQEERCTATLTRVSGLEIGPILCDVQALIEIECGPPWNEAWGFYHPEGDSLPMVGLVEFREGVYWTAYDPASGLTGVSFGYKPDEVTIRRLCNVDDWREARVALGAPVDLCMRTVRGDVRCGP